LGAWFFFRNIDLGSLVLFQNYWPGRLALFQEYRPGIFFRNIGGGACFFQEYWSRSLVSFSGIVAWKLVFLQEYLPGSLIPFLGIFARRLDICFRKIGCELKSFF
jgi:hypothetical protein